MSGYFMRSQREKMADSENGGGSTFDDVKKGILDDLTKSMDKSLDSRLQQIKNLIEDKKQVLSQDWNISRKSSKKARLLSSPKSVICSY